MCGGPYPRPGAERQSTSVGSDAPERIDDVSNDAPEWNDDVPERSRSGLVPVVAVGLGVRRRAVPVTAAVGTVVALVLWRRWWRGHAGTDHSGERGGDGDVEQPGRGDVDGVDGQRGGDGVSSGAVPGDRVHDLCAGGDADDGQLPGHGVDGGDELQLPGAGDGRGRQPQWLLGRGQCHDVDGDGKWTNSDVVEGLGQKGDLPIVGDFNGDGIDELGVYRDGTWIIDTNGNGAIDADDQVFRLGGPGDKPVVGDWDGNGTSDPGIYHDQGKAVTTARK